MRKTDGAARDRARKWFAAKRWRGSHVRDQEKRFPCRDFAFPDGKSDFPLGISHFPTGKAISLSAFRISRQEKAISLSAFRISRSAKVIS